MIGMKTSLALIVGFLALGGVARAQGAPAATDDKGYVEVVGQSAFSDVTSQSYGVEGGITIRPHLQIYVEFGRTLNVSPSALGAGAQTIAGAISRYQSNVGYSAKEPATFFTGGIRYAFDVHGSKVQPYVLAGAGVARLQRNVTFTVNGTDVTANLAQDQYGNVVLGSDLSGSETKAMFALGGGLAIPVWQMVVIDLQVRYGHIFASDAGINLTRAGVGIGVRF
jgi:opacity protein-like surface antigen